MASENGALAKLTSLRQNFLADVNDARERFVTTIKSLREAYITEVVDATLTDPQLTDVERALSGATPTAPPAAAPAVPPPGPGMVPIGQAPPEKFPMKRLKGFGVYGRCGNCNATILEPQAKFCSQCAYPLDEL